MIVGRCNNIAVIPNIPCPKECTIVGQLLVDHALSYALAATIDVPAVYIQQSWKTVKQVPNVNETIRFMVDIEEITYTMDMFRAIGTDIQKESQKRPNQARDGKDKVKSKPKSVKVKSQPHEENTT
ncbi:hypothetical protein Tco_0658201 [Tanacetum coccineum]